MNNNITVNKTYKFDKNSTVFILITPKSSAGNVTKAQFYYKMNETWVLEPREEESSSEDEGMSTGV